LFDRTVLNDRYAEECDQLDAHLRSETAQVGARSGKRSCEAGAKLISAMERGLAQVIVDVGKKSGVAVHGNSAVVRSLRRTPHARVAKTVITTKFIYAGGRWLVADQGFLSSGRGD
jgi:hypothetical protein